MPKNMKPDLCTSLTCESIGSKYCLSCSHGLFYGKGKDKNGKEWSWEFSNFFGPTFLTKKGKPLKSQCYEEDHPVWGAFNKWFKRFEKRRQKAIHDRWTK